eukprot:TRINITY_DN60628_c0_g1_i1.p1 TRINITY_DN60628_c0_g1~~TRINITY_DN60628_c0_g1_i1.p1  ORF type:complete len:716 (+),score=47.95 TRINITY_DN60628_c0_g1_i1:39-2150(+)
MGSFVVQVETPRSSFRRIPSVVALKRDGSLSSSMMALIGGPVGNQSRIKHKTVQEIREIFSQMRALVNTIRDKKAWDIEVADLTYWSREIRECIEAVEERVETLSTAATMSANNAPSDPVQPPVVLERAPGRRRTYAGGDIPSTSSSSPVTEQNKHPQPKPKPKPKPLHQQQINPRAQQQQSCASPVSMMGDANTATSVNSPTPTQQLLQRSNTNNSMLGGLGATSSSLNGSMLNLKLARFGSPGNSHSFHQTIGGAIYVLLEALCAQVGAERATLFQYVPKTDELQGVAVVGSNDLKPNMLRIPVTYGFCGAVYESEIGINVSNVYADDTFYAELDKKTGFRTRTMLAFPIKALQGTSVIGVVQFLNKNRGTANFSCDDESFVSSCCPCLSYMLSHYPIDAVHNYFDNSILHSAKPFEPSAPTDSILSPSMQKFAEPQLVYRAVQSGPIRQFVITPALSQPIGNTSLREVSAQIRNLEDSWRQALATNLTLEKECDMKSEKMRKMRDELKKSELRSLQWQDTAEKQKQLLTELQLKHEQQKQHSMLLSSIVRGKDSHLSVSMKTNLNTEDESFSGLAVDTQTLSGLSSPVHKRKNSSTTPTPTNKYNSSTTSSKSKSRSSLPSVTPSPSSNARKNTIALPPRVGVTEIEPHPPSAPSTASKIRRLPSVRELTATVEQLVSNPNNAFTSKELRRMSQSLGYSF